MDERNKLGRYIVLYTMPIHAILFCLAQFAIHSVFKYLLHVLSLSLWERNQHKTASQSNPSGIITFCIKPASPL